MKLFGLEIHNVIEQKKATAINVGVGWDVDAISDRFVNSKKQCSTMLSVPELHPFCTSAPHNPLFFALLAICYTFYICS